MYRTPRPVIIVLATATVLGGCGRVTQVPSQPAFATGAAARSSPALPQQQQYAADDSVCRWSVPACGGGCGGGGGEEYVEPAETIAAAVVADLIGDSPSFSYDGLLVATVEGGTTVHIWHSDDGSLERDLAGSAFVFRPGSDTIAVHQEDGWHLWNTTSWEEVGWHAAPDTKLYFSQNSPGYSGSFHFDADMSAGSIFVDPVFFSGDGNTLVMQAISKDTGLVTVWLYNIPSAAELPTIEGVTLPIAISTDGSLLATTRPQNIGAFGYNSIVLWDTATGSEVQEMKPEIQSELPLAGLRGHRSISSLAFSPDGSALLSAGRDAVRLWDTTNGTHLRCFETPDQQGALQAAWGTDGATIITTPASTGVPCMCDANFEQDVYVWNTDTNHPTGMISLREPPNKEAIGLSPETSDGKVLTWRGHTVADDVKDRKAFVWDLGAQELDSVLPTRGYLTQGSISPDGERAVTVSYYGGGTDDAGGDTKILETLLWDTTQRGLAKTAAAQTSYWDALEAAWGGRLASAQQRSLRRARSLSPELFSSVTEISPEVAAAYGASLDRAEMVHALADAAGSAGAAFDAEIRATDPKWLAFSSSDLAAQVARYIELWLYWYPGDRTGLATAYQDFAQLDPATAFAPELVDAFLDQLAPDATALARQGDVEGAAAALQEALAPYPGLQIDTEVAAKRISSPGTGAALLTPGSTVVGTVASDTAGYWSFEGTAGTYVTIDLEAVAGDLDPYLYLFAPDDSLIGENDDFSGSDARIAMLLPVDGIYEIEATGYQGTGGDYMLTLTNGTQP